MKRLTILSILAFVFVLCVSTANANTFVRQTDNFIFLFDSSGSMGETFKPTGEPKIKVAKDLIDIVNEGIPDFPYWSALYTFTPWHQYYGPAMYDKQAFDDAIDSLPVTVDSTVFGHPTPLGKTFRELGKLLEPMKGETIIYLFSDGVSTDNINFNYLKKYNELHDVCYIIISLADTKQGHETLQAIADAAECAKIYTFREVYENRARLSEEIYTPIIVPAPMIEQGPPMIPVYFQFDSDVVNQPFYPYLDALAADLMANPDMTVVLTGNADDTGAADYNLELSKRRAENVGRYLMKQGVPGNQIGLRWFGINRPMYSNDTAGGRRKNRRVDYAIIR